MNKEIKEKWVAALRSGEFKQAEAALYDIKTNSFCCLGVLCKVMTGRIPTDEDADENEGEYLNQELAEQAGITFDQQQTLAAMNDGIKNYDKEFFPGIADYIEENL